MKKFLLILICFSVFSEYQNSFITEKPVIEIFKKRLRDSRSLGVLHTKIEFDCGKICVLQKNASLFSYSVTINTISNSNLYSRIEQIEESSNTVSLSMNDTLKLKRDINSLTVGISRGNLITVSCAFQIARHRSLVLSNKSFCEVSMLLFGTEMSVLLIDKTNAFAKVTCYFLSNLGSIYFRHFSKSKSILDSDVLNKRSILFFMQIEAGKTISNYFAVFLSGKVETFRSVETEILLSIKEKCFVNCVSFCIGVGNILF